MLSSRNLENLDRAELLATVRRLLGEADALSSRISAVNEIGVAMNRTLDLETIQKVIAKQAKWLLDFGHCSVCLRDENEQWHIQTLFGPEEARIVDLDSMVNLASTLETGHPKLVSTGSPSPFLAAFASQMLIPLSADDKLLGTINFATEEPNSYTHDDMRIGYMLSLQLSSAIRNAGVVAQLRGTQDELSLRVRELDAYAHTIAHDLKSPLSSIFIRSQLFEMRFTEQVPAEALEIIRTIRESSQLMNRMIDQLLWLAKLRDQNEALTPVNVNETVQSAVLRFTHLIEQQNIKVEIAPDLPCAQGHAQWIEEIFANLISNAIKYMGESNAAPHIQIGGKAIDDHVRFEVTDTGVGIKSEDCANLFEMFTRLHTVDTEGLGLGLSIVHRIVKKLNGEIGVESTFGDGSTFWFTLPADEQSEST